MSNTTQILDAHSYETALSRNTSIDHSLKKHSSEYSNYSPGSIPTDMQNSELGCRHNKIITQENFDTCFHCGAYVSKNGVQTFKNKSMNYFAFFPPKTIYESITKRSFPLKKSMNPEYAQLRQKYVEWLLELCEKMRISSNTAHLSVTLLDFVMFHEPSLTTKLQLYAPVCLLVAAKTIELDERIPFIPRLRRHTSSTYTVEDFTKAELHVLDAVDWNAQLSFFMEINEFLMCQGVLFSNDDLEDAEGVNDKGKWGPEGLREIHQYENTNHFGNKDNSINDSVGYSADISLNRAASSTYEDGVPGLSARLVKTNSMPVNLENHFAALKLDNSVKKKAGEILTVFENNYPKLNSLLLKDIDFIEFEPKIVSAASVAFFRSLNKITPAWNSELEAITSLKFSQISSCFDIIAKKYNSVFSFQVPRYQKSFSTGLEANRNIPLAIAGNNKLMPAGYDMKPFEQKPMSNYQSKSNIPAVNSYLSENYRDDSRYKVKYGNGTTENYYPDKSYENDYTVKSYYNGSANSSVSYSGSTASMENYSTGSRSSISNDGYLKNDTYYKNPMLSDRTNSSAYENGLPYQPRLDLLKK